MTGGAKPRLAERVAEKLVWIWRLIKGWLPQVLGTAATVVSIAWAAYGTAIWTAGFWIFLLAAALLVLSIVAQIGLQRPSYMKLAKDLEVAQENSSRKSKAIEESLEVLLRKLAEHCGVDANTDRASVYYFHRDRFVMLSRWSEHPLYAQPGRKEYRTGEGAIWEAWLNRSVAQQLPDRRDHWNSSLENKHGFEKGAPAILKMQCRSIAALRIEHNHRPVGVVVFESTDKARANQDVLDTSATSMLYGTLTELVGTIATLTPRLEELAATAAIKPADAPVWKPTASAGA